MVPFKTFVQKLIAQETLDKETAYAAIKTLCLHDTPPSQGGAFLAILAMRGETAEELSGFLQFLQEHTHPIPIDETADFIDIVGTGGDALQTFNISTAASLVVASGGVTVAKHGGRSISSRSGSADVIESLGIPLLNSPIAIVKSLNHHHFAFLFAPFFNPVLMKQASLRRELGIRTFFNVLAPLANPLRVKRQVIGLYSADLFATVIPALKNSGCLHAMAVHSADGMDEISISASTEITELKNGKIEKYTLKPQDYGLPLASLHDLQGGDAKENAQIISRILDGSERGPKRDIVLLNAAAGFLVADKVTDFADGIQLAAHCIDTGASTALLNTLTDKNSYG